MRRLALLLAVTALLAPRSARADFPALSRELVPEPVPAATDTVYTLELGRAAPARTLEAAFSLNWFSRKLDPGNADPELSDGEIGGRAQVALTLGRVVFGADITEDGFEDVDSREYPSRFHVTGRWPELGLAGRVVAGMGEHQYAGTDIEVESVRLRLLGPRDGAHLGLGACLRARWLERQDHTLWTPAASLVAGPMSGATVALTVEPDLVVHEVPTTFGMVQVVWVSGAGAVGEPGLPSRLGAPSAFEIARRWFGYANYAFPLDDRQIGRFTLGLGLRLGVPIGRRD